MCWSPKFLQIIIIQLYFTTINNQTGQSRNSSTTHTSGTQQSQPAPKKTRLLDVDCETELQTYFDQQRLDVDPLHFWCQRKQSALSVVALQLLSVPCSSAPVERLFSKAGIILSQRRSRIASTKLEKLVFIK